MRYTNAKRLRNGDEIIIKKYGCTQYVVTIERPDEKTVLVHCDDGCVYHHSEIL